MSTAVGQVSAIIIQGTPPGNTNVTWLDTSGAPYRFKIYDTVLTEWVLQSPTYIGVYQLALTYVGSSIVLFSDGNIYIAKKAVPAGTAPGNTTYWGLWLSGGTSGTNGSGFLQGPGKPSVGTGADGDYSFDYLTGALFKKVTGGWAEQDSSSLRFDRRVIMVDGSGPIVKGFTEILYTGTPTPSYEGDLNLGWLKLTVAAADETGIITPYCARRTRRSGFACLIKIPDDNTRMFCGLISASAFTDAADGGNSEHLGFRLSREDGDTKVKFSHSDGVTYVETANGNTTSLAVPETPYLIILRFIGSQPVLEIYSVPGLVLLGSYQPTTELPGMNTELRFHITMFNHDAGAVDWWFGYSNFNT